MDHQQQTVDPYQNGFNLPANSHPPQQFFGGQSQNASPLLPEFTFGEEYDDGQYDDGGQGGTHEGKRRRIARACDMCRKKKIKCDGGMPSCKNCISYKTECIFTHVEKKRNPPKGAKYIEGLENRLARMENLLRKSGLLDGSDGQETDLGTLERNMAKRTGIARDDTPDTQPTSGSQPPALDSPHDVAPGENGKSPSTSIKSPDTLKDDRDGAEELSDLMCTLVTNNAGDTRYVGSSSGFSIFSPKGIEWVNEKTGDTSFQEMITQASVHDIKWAYWKPEIFSDLFARRTFHPLPPRDEAHSLLRDFFENFNCMFPLFHEPTFMHLVDRQYSRQPYEGSGWWASLNCALAIAHRLRVMSNLVPQEEDRKGWAYLKNAMGVLTELTMRNTDLLSVQALLGMALFLLGTPNPQPSFFLVAAATRLANSIGLHKRGSGFNLNAVEIEQRSRVFWIAYLLDKDICLRSGRPPAQDDDDMNVDLPTEDPSDNIGNVPLTDGKGKVNLFRLMVEFAIIESKVYKNLYSTKAAKQSDGVLLNTIGELDKELEEWKDRIPLELRPEHEIKANHPPLILHVAVLHFAYYNCRTTIHRMCVHHGYWTDRLSSYALQGLNTRAVNPRVFQSAALCVDAARKSIQLIRYIPQGDYSCVWLILYFPVSALVTLFANILQNPQDSQARSDVKLMNQVVNFLSLLSVTEEQGGVKRMLGVCSEFERIANCVLDRTDKSSRQKRKSSKAAPSGNGNVNHSTHTTPQSANARISPQSNHMQPKSVMPQNLTPEMANQPFNSRPGRFSPSLAEMNSPHGDISQPHDQTSDSSPLLNRPSTNPEGGGPIDGHNPMPDMNQFPTDNPTSPLNMGAFQQPFVPQDLWNMNMTFEWDWADMSHNAGSAENGQVDGQGQGQAAADMQTQESGLCDGVADDQPGAGECNNV